MGVLIHHKEKHKEWAVWKISETLEELKGNGLKIKLNDTVSMSYKSDLRKKQWFAVRLLLNELLPGKLIRYEGSGKPVIEGCFISISHSHDLIAISLNATADTGIDIQLYDQKILRIQKNS